MPLHQNLASSRKTIPQLSLTCQFNPRRQVKVPSLLDNLFQLTILVTHIFILVIDIFILSTTPYGRREALINRAAFSYTG
jgi:hypothetical protein